MRRTAIVLLLVILLAVVAFAQTPPLPSVDLLGAHDMGGRGCPICHVSARGASRNETTGAPRVETAAQPWGASTTPVFGETVTLGDGSRSIEVSPAVISTPDREVNGILACVSCHDGNVVPPSMMAGQTFEQAIGLLPKTGGRQLVPTMIVRNDIVGGDDANDHPVGTSAVIASGQGLVWANNAFAVVPGSPYARFVSNYGWPSLVPGRWSNPWGVSSSGEPFLLCTTCHNQHVMAVYMSSSSSPIANDSGGNSYATFFFVNGPYNSDLILARNPKTSSSTQFCRQCHFELSNEANNTNSVPTILPDR